MAKRRHVRAGLKGGGHLFGALQRMASENRFFSPSEASRLMVQVAAGVRVLHSQTPPVAHRDLKLENVLLTADGECKLCDFGSAAVGPQCVQSASERSKEEEFIEKNTEKSQSPSVQISVGNLDNREEFKNN